MGEIGKKEASKSVITGLVFAACLALAWTADAGVADKGHWYSIVPPLLAVCLAFLTHRVVLSLAVAVFTGGLLAIAPKAVAGIAFVDRVLAGPGYVWASVSDTTNLQILLFVILVMAGIAVMITAGGLQGLVNWLGQYAKTSRSSQFVAALMGFILFIDDYANTMIIGNSARPLTDRRNVSREKLAFIVDATSAPIAGLAVVSTWIGYEVGLFGKVSESLAMNRDGYSMFFDALPFRFYCILMIAFVIINTLSGADFGPMAKAQRRAEKGDGLLEKGAVPMTSEAFSSSEPHMEATVHLASALIPIAGLFMTLLGGLWIDGGGMARLSESSLALVSLGQWREVMSASENSILLLAISAGVSCILAILCAVTFSQLKFSVVWRSLVSGVRGSLLPMVILILAWSLKGACDGVSTGPFLIATVGQVVSPLWFPALIFMVSGMTAFATGTSWGTMAILIPTAIPIAFALDGNSYGLVTVICLGAVLDGAIFGDHCSPISDTTIMSSISSSCDHIHHVRTQIPYSLAVGAMAVICGYIPAALGTPSWLGIAVAVVVMLMFFTYLRRKDSPLLSAQTAN